MIYDDVIKALISAQIPSPRLEARLLIAAAGNLPADEVCYTTLLSPEEQAVLAQMLKQRVAHKPLDKILGHKAFYKSDFKVNEKVLSPRPDTEISVEAALEIIKKEKITDIADFGTGSGCILLSLLLEVPDLRGIGIDKSADALQVAQQNAASLGIGNRCKLLMADWFEPDFTSKIAEKFQLIISNPPYIPDADIGTLEEEVKNYDPYLALSGGQDGLSSYRKIAETAPLLLNDKGYIVLETGIGQTEDVKNIFMKNGFEYVKTVPDLAGIDRCLIFRKNDCI